MFAEHKDCSKPELEDSSDPFPWFSFFPDEAGGGGGQTINALYLTLQSPQLICLRKHNL